MLKNPRVSIITVVYNGEKYLQQTIDSVKNQTYKNIEYIIVDGGSVDNTLDIIKANKSCVSKWISEPDKGLYDAMNKGINMAEGELIGMINSDDWYEPNIVEVMVNQYLKTPNKSIFHSDRYDIYPDNTKKIYKFNSSVFKFKYISMTYNHPSMFITRKEYSEHMYNINLKVYSDYQFTLEAFLRNRNKFCYVNKPLVNFRLGGVSGQISIKENLKEGFIARKISGMNMVENVMAVGLKITVLFINKYFR
jgi:glycosyltransferase involved in cell wall biosynthesis